MTYRENREHRFTQLLRFFGVPFNWSKRGMWGGLGLNKVGVSCSRGQVLEADSQIFRIPSAYNTL